MAEPAHTAPENGDEQLNTTPDHTHDRWAYLKDSDELDSGFLPKLFDTHNHMSV
jgi:hypothetical protein